MEPITGGAQITGQRTEADVTSPRHVSMYENKTLTSALDKLLQL